MSLKRNFIFLTLLFSSISSIADIDDDLFSENKDASDQIRRYTMDCSRTSPTCIERKSALEAETSFNEIFQVGLDRGISKWPNDELNFIEKALSIRKAADIDFIDSFFGNAAEQYVEATQIIYETLEQGDNEVRDLLEIAEAYLYEDGKPEWAAPYFNDAAPYDPESKRIAKGLARIRFLRDFENDLADIQEYMRVGSYVLALNLIKETLKGDPGNKTLLELEIEAQNGEVGLEVNEKSAQFSVEFDLAKSIDEREELLTKVQKALSIYGFGEMTQELQNIKATLEETIFNEKLKQIQDQFIENSGSLEDIYLIAKQFAFDNKSNTEAQDLFDQIKQERDTYMLDSIKDDAKVAIESESWETALEKLREIYLIDKSPTTKQEVTDIEDIIQKLNSLNYISENASANLFNQEKINSASWLLNALRKYANQETPKLNKLLVEFEGLIDAYQVMVNEESLKNKNKKEITKTKPKVQKSKTKPKVQKSKNDSPSNIAEPKVLRNASKPKLDVSSFVKSANCTRRIRNKSFVAIYMINVSSSGKALSVVLSNGDELKLNTRDKDAEKVVKEALYNSKYRPAKADDIFVSSSYSQKLAIPSNFCS
jgi:hypothetical protein